MKSVRKNKEILVQTSAVSDIPLAPEVEHDIQQNHVRGLLQRRVSAELLRLMDAKSSIWRNKRREADTMLTGWMDLLSAEDLTLSGRAEFRHGILPNQLLAHQVESELSFTHRGAAVVVSASRGEDAVAVSVQGDPTDGGEAIEPYDPVVYAAARLVGTAVGHTVFQSPSGQLREDFPVLPNAVIIALEQVQASGPAAPLAAAA